jgi:uncharacterized protein YjfI (DUF2170 family)
MTSNWIACTSKDHEGETVYINLDRVDMIYAAEDGSSIVVMADWEDGPIHVKEPPEQLLRDTSWKRA